MWLLLQSNQTMHRWRDATPTAGPLFALAERFVRIHSPFGKTANQTCFPQFDRSVHSCQRYEKGLLVLLCSPQLVTVIFVKLMPMTHSSSSHSALPSPPSLSIDQTVSQGEGHWNPPNRRDFGLALIHNQSTSNIESSCLCWKIQLLSSRLTFHWLSQGILIKDKNCSVLQSWNHNYQMKCDPRRICRFWPVCTFVLKSLCFWSSRPGWVVRAVSGHILMELSDYYPLT